MATTPTLTYTPLARDPYDGESDRRSRRVNTALEGISGLNEQGILDLYDLYQKGTGSGKTFTYGNSTLSAARTKIDPAVTGLQAQSAGLATTGLSNIQQSRQDTIGDPNTFVERRTEGLRSGIATARENLEQRLGKTGVGGEFGRQSMESFQTSAQQKMASGQKLAMDEFNSLQGKFDIMEGGAAELIKNIDMNDFAQQMQARGLSQELQSKLTRIAQGRDAISDQKSAQDKQMLGNMVMAFAMFSSRTFKHEKEPIDNDEILQSLMGLEIETWKYIGDDDVHIGCYAEDFNEAFGLEEEKSIAIVDAIGVLMASVQAQQKHIEELQEKLDGRD